MLSASRVCVLGSVNVDVAVRAARAPRAGETVLGTARTRGLGGKGANQAVAATRAGATVRFVGAVGDDDDSAFALGRLRHAGVDVRGVHAVAGTETGYACVVVTDDGENRIVVVPGANEHCGPVEVAALTSVIADVDVLVVQGEIPAACTAAALRVAREHGRRAVVNLAPVTDLGACLSVADPLVVNEVEAAQLAGGAADVEALGGLARSVVVTLGSRGAVVVRGDRVDRVPAPDVDAVRDTTGAGDALVGVLAAGLAGGLDVVAATAAGVAAASRSVTVLGASDAYPDFDVPVLRGAR